MNKKKAIVVARGWLGDTIACSAAASSLSNKGYDTTLLIRWPQLKPIFDTDTRFHTQIYGRFLTYKVQRPLIRSLFDVVITEPKGWNYKEPFTCQIRRIAGCDPAPEYQLFLPASLRKIPNINGLPTVCIARDIYKRSYHRDIPDLINRLSAFYNIQWVGLDPLLNSKHGKKHSLMSDAQYIYQADLFIGPEGGLLWLAAGLGTKCIYLTEHILALEKTLKTNNLLQVLGSKNHFPAGSHVPIPAYSTNQDIIDLVAVNIQL